MSKGATSINPVDLSSQDQIQTENAVVTIMKSDEEKIERKRNDVVVKQEIRVEKK